MSKCLGLRPEVSCLGLLQLGDLIAEVGSVLKQCGVVSQMSVSFGSVAFMLNSRISTVCQRAVADCPTTLLLQLVSWPFAMICLLSGSRRYHPLLRLVLLLNWSKWLLS